MSYLSLTILKMVINEWVKDLKFDYIIFKKI